MGSISSPREWLKQNAAHFSEPLSGYSETPFMPYIETLPFINRGGRVIDLGCGNGMLLKFLMEYSGRKITPFGVDSSELSIEDARKSILPEYKNNFFLGDIEKFDFSTHQPFDIIILGNPFHVIDPRKFAETCYRNLCSEGRMIYRIHGDVLRNRKRGISKLINEGRRFGLEYHEINSDSGRFAIATLDRI